MENVSSLPETFCGQRSQNANHCRPDQRYLPLTEAKSLNYPDLEDEKPAQKR